MPYFQNYIDDQINPALGLQRYDTRRYSYNTHRSVRPLNFEKFASDGNRIVNEIARELRTDRNRAARILRSVLHAVRDRIPADDAIQFAQGLPMALKAIFIDQYDLSRTPVVIRNVTEFLNYIYIKHGRAAVHDFPDEDSIAEGLQAVFFVLENNMDYAQVRQIKKMMNQEIVDLIDDF